MKRINNTIPEFKSLEEEKKYWETRGPLAEEAKGRLNKPKTKPTRSSFLVVRLTGEELTRLRDLAAKQRLGPSTFARLLLLLALEHQNESTKEGPLDQLQALLEKMLPPAVREKKGLYLKK